MTSIKFKKGELVVRTDGKGLWTDVKKDVDIRLIEVISDERGETFVRVFPRNWNNDTEGLIYTDPGFRKSLREKLEKLKVEAVNWKKLDYTEQGMQGGCRFSCPDSCKSHPPFVHMIIGS